MQTIASDHKPVIAEISLDVSKGPLKKTSKNEARFSAQLARWKISFLDFFFDNASTEVQEIYEMNDLYAFSHFPLLCEDPVGDQRSLMVLPGISERFESSICQPCGAVHPNIVDFRVPIRHEQEEHQAAVCIFEALVYREFTHAVLVKFVDGKGRDLGQGVLGISPSCISNAPINSYYATSLSPYSMVGPLERNGWSGDATVRLSSGGIFSGYVKIQFSVVETPFDV